MQSFLQAQRQEGAGIGFVPTMGALHEGHLSLVLQSKQRNRISVVSIFVNPTQFNEAADLERYPRTLGEDLDMLYEVGCEVVFAPAVEEIYPPGLDTEMLTDLDGLDEPMEGIFRPGHFRGMGQVVLRLLDIVKPDELFMGQKDFQQFAIIRHLINRLELPVTLVMCSTIREPNGLAMSSRNSRLDAGTRSDAAIIYETLRFCAEQFEQMPLSELQEICLKKLDIPGFRPEYFEIVDGVTLLPATEDTTYVVACCAVWAGDVRLIDNMVLKPYK